MISMSIKGLYLDKLNKRLSISLLYPVIKRQIKTNNSNNNNNQKQFDENLLFSKDKIGSIKYSNQYNELKEIINSKNKVNFTDPVSFIKEELSEEEFVDSFMLSNKKQKDISERTIRFRSPPLTIDEMKEVIQETDEIYENSKSFLFNTNSDFQFETTKQNIALKIPHNMLFATLSLFPSTSEIAQHIGNCTINLIGVKEESDKHSEFLYSLLEEAKPDSIVISLCADSPYLINPESNGSKKYPDDAWKTFLENPSNETKFYASSKPSKISEITLSPDAIKSFIEINCVNSNKLRKAPKLIYANSNNILENKLYEIESNIRGNTEERKVLEYFGNTYLTALLYSYNSLSDEKYTNIVIGGMPKMEEAKYLINEYYTKTLQDQFVSFLDNVNKENYDFDPFINMRYVEPNYPIKSKYSLKNVHIKYITEVIKQAAIGKSNIVALVDFRLMEEIVKEWSNIEILNFNEKTNKIEFSINRLENFYLNNLFNIESSGLDLFNFFEKCVLVDFILNGYISNNYVPYKVFPLNYDEILYKARDKSQKENSNENVLITAYHHAWEYYFSEYYKKFNHELILVEKIYRDYLKLYNNGYEVKKEDYIFNNKL